MDIPYGRPLFSVQDGLLWPLYGTLWGLPYRKEPFSVRDARLGMQARPARAENRHTRLSSRFHRQQVMASS